MNKYLLLIALILIVITGFFLWLFIQGEQSTHSGPEATKETVRQAFLGEGAVTCSFVDNEGNMSGNFHIKHGYMYFNVIIDSMEAEIFEGGGLRYVWGPLIEVEFELSPGQGIVNRTHDDTLFGHIDYFQNEEEFGRIYETYDFFCTEGAPEELFELPEGIEFTTK